MRNSARTVKTSKEFAANRAEDRGVPLRPNTVLAVDVVLFTVRDAEDLEDRWQVLLVRSSKRVFAGKRALPGVLVREEETFEQAAGRALREKCGLDASEWYLDQLATYADPGRDDRGRVASVAHVGLVRSDEIAPVPGGSVTGAEWVPVRQALREDLAFDHSQMLHEAARRLRSKLRYSWVAFQLMPERFTLTELRAVYAAILDPKVARLNTTNFRYAFRDLFESGIIEPAGERAEAQGKGRPGELYRFRGALAGTRERERPGHGA
jgi:8-oxo-dGTP diphosphatase